MVAADLTPEQVFAWLADIPDPEIPVLNILDLGIVRDVVINDNVTVSICPTYSACPATEVIESTVKRTLIDHGIDAPRIKRLLSPPWTTDWITEDGREKLRAYGIAPPEKRRPVTCPRCESANAEIISEFGSTACKASWRCLDCLEPFEYFKCL